MKRAISRGTAGPATFLALSLAVAVLPAATSAQRAGMRPGGVPHINTPHVFITPVSSRRPVFFERPIFPILRPPRFAFWGVPFYGFGLDLNLNSIFWRNCGPYGGGIWGYNCYAVPVYIADGEGRELPQLYMKDGTVYNVTDYWVVNNQLHFTTIDESGTKWVEHTVAFDQLDLQKTVDVSKERGFHFLLRNEPLRDYLRDHPEIGAPADAPPKSVNP